MMEEPAEMGILIFTFTLLSLFYSFYFSQVFFLICFGVLLGFFPKKYFQQST